MIAPPANTRIWIAAGVTDLRRGFMGLRALCERLLSSEKTIYLLGRTPEASEQLQSIADRNSKAERP